MAAKRRRENTSDVEDTPDSTSALTGNEKRSSSPFDTQTQTSKAVKQSIPDKDKLEGLAHELTEEWDKLGRRLGVKEARLKAFNKQNADFFDKAYQMLSHWMQREGSAATYQVLYDALCHSYVDRKDLAEEYCCDR